MKTISLKILTLVFAGLLVSAAAQEQQQPGDNNPPPATGAEPEANAPATATETPPDGSVTLPAEAVAALANGDNAGAGERKTNSEPNVILPADSTHPARGVYDSNFLPPLVASGTNNPNELRLNFRNAPLEMVLNYLSDAAGFIIVLDTHVNGSVNIISGQPVTKDEAVDLLNAVLNKNGYAAIRSGRTLTIVDKNEAKTRDIPVKSGNNPDEIPKNAEIVTQIIPIRFVEARQLVSDLTSFVSPQATVVANEAGNSIVITDTQQNIRHLTEIIKAIDGSAEAETEIRVFHLKHASPTDVATELASIFPSSGSGSSSQSPIRFGGGFGGGGGGNPFSRFFGGGGGGGDRGGGGGGSSSGSSNDRIKKATQVSAVADTRIQAVIVTAPKDLLEQIAGMMKDLDVASTRDQKVYVFQMKNGDPQQAAAVLQTMFQSSSSRSSSSSSQNSALQQRAQNNATTTTSSSSSSGFGGSTGGGGTRGGGGF